MKKVIIFSVFFCLPVYLYAQLVRDYNLEVDIKMVPKTLAVTGFFEIDWQGRDSVQMILWKETDIRSIATFDGRPLNYRHNRDFTPSIYISNGGEFVIYREGGEPQQDKIYIDYTCDMAGLRPGFGKCFEDIWLNIGFYTAWYPLHIGSRGFTSQVSLSIDGGMIIDGSGALAEEDGRMVLRQESPSSDIVLVASRVLRKNRVEKEGICLEILSVDISPETIEGMLAETSSVYDYYKALLKRAGEGAVKFAIPPGGRGSGYARNNFIVLMTGDILDNVTSRGIAHEMAHFWFNRAPEDTWEDWLNEAFAEYLSFRYLKDKTGSEPAYGYGNLQFDTWVELFEHTTRNAPPIYGVDRNTPEAYAALYEYGALMLREFEGLVGHDEFVRMLRSILDNKIGNTREFLSLLEREFPGWAAPWFAGKLGLPDNFTEMAIMTKETVM
ncbi:MAG: hypothetical protein LIO77_10180 [Rikenellaceae bacterium]|nr:hypothetical protein [Rikenellaceae bacterium]